MSRQTTAGSGNNSPCAFGRKVPYVTARIQNRFPATRRNLPSTLGRREAATLAPRPPAAAGGPDAAAPLECADPVCQERRGGTSRLNASILDSPVPRWEKQRGRSPDPRAAADPLPAALTCPD